MGLMQRGSLHRVFNAARSCPFQPKCLTLGKMLKLIEALQRLVAVRRYLSCSALGRRAFPRKHCQE